MASGPGSQDRLFAQQIFFENDHGVLLIAICKAQTGKTSHIKMRSTLNNIGEVWLVRHKFDEAASWFAEAAKQKRDLKDRSGLVISLNNVADLKIRRGNLTRALEYVLEAERVARET